jgi:hypothetical protein
MLPNLINTTGSTLGAGSNIYRSVPANQGCNFQGAYTCTPNKSQPYTLEIDASGTAMGTVLSQRKEDDCYDPAEFMSASLFPAELNYDLQEEKLLPNSCAFGHRGIFQEGTNVTTKEKTSLKVPWEFEITLKGGNGTR